MAEQNVREYVIATLKPLLPRKWKIQPFSNIPDEITTTTLVLTFQNYSRPAASPRGTRMATYVLTLLTAKIVPGEADNDLDDAIMDLLNALDQIAGKTGIVWTTAERGEASGRAGFDITITNPVDYQPAVVQETL